MMIKDFMPSNQTMAGSQVLLEGGSYVLKLGGGWHAVQPEAIQVNKEIDRMYYH
jgi:hypothetical protein